MPLNVLNKFMEEQKKEEELKETPSEAPAEDQPKEELKEDNPKAPEGTDYKAELEKLRQEKENYKEGLLNAKEKLKENKREENPDDGEEKIDMDQVNKLLEEKISEMRNDINSTSVESILASVSSDKDEAALIREHYNTSITKSGKTAEAIRNDLENAKILANKTKILSENEELRVALGAKNSATSAGIGANNDKPNPEPEVSLNPIEKGLFERTNKRRVSRGEKALTESEFLNA